jgi:hypothetical protein
MKFPALEYIRWAKSQRPVAINLARSGIDACPPSLLRLTRSDLVTTLPVKYGYQPLLEAIGGRYDVAPDRVLTLSGGTSFANYVAVCSGARRRASGSTCSGRAADLRAVAADSTGLRTPCAAVRAAIRGRVFNRHRRLREGGSRGRRGWRL